MKSSHLGQADAAPTQSPYHQGLWFGEQDAKLIGPWLSGAGGVYLESFRRPDPSWAVCYLGQKGMGMGWDLAPSPTRQCGWGTEQGHAELWRGLEDLWLEMARNLLVPGPGLPSLGHSPQRFGAILYQ